MQKAIDKLGTYKGVAEYRLSNGMRILHRQESSSPVVAACVTFHVGSRNEAPGHTGSTHILEHLLFKDSKLFNKANGKSITGYLDTFGAILNASTWLDRTNYYELLPREYLREALAMEADRMRNSLFNDADLASEMTVVRNEYERSRNDPFELLDEEMMAQAYDVHPYRIPTIGTKDDIEHSTAAKLRDFYDVFYWPNNATLMVVGDISWSELRPMVLELFGSIPKSPKKIPAMSIKEPPQTNAKQVVLRKPMGVNIASLLYKVPQGTHKEFASVLLCVAILANGYSSRLRKVLVDSGLAAEISASAHAQHDPGVATFSAHVADNHKPEMVLETMRNEIAEFARIGPSKEELRRAKERLIAEFASERDGVLNEVRAVSEALAAGDWKLAYELQSVISTLTADEVRRAARKYFTDRTETSGLMYNIEEEVESQQEL